MCRILIMKIISQYNALSVFEEELIRNWRDMGVKVDRQSIGCDEDLLKLCKNDYDVIFVMNGVIFQDRNEEQLKKYFNIPVYSYYVDHPLYHNYRLRQSANQKCILVDKDYATYIDRHYSHDNIVAMQAGVEGINSNRAYIDRKYPVVFCGSYRDCEKILENINKSEESFKQFQLMMIERGLQNPAFTLEQIFDYLLNKLGLDLDEEEYTEFLAACRNVELYFRAYYRQNVIKKLVESGIPVEVYGNGWEKLDCAHKELLHCHAPIDYHEMPDLFADTQIVINVMPWAKAGFHDRVACAMLNGALVVTDETSYMKEQLLNGDKLITYSLSSLEELPNKVAYYVEHLDEAEVIAKKGYVWAKENHTWRNRAEQFLEEFKKGVESHEKETCNTASNIYEELKGISKLWEQYTVVLSELEILDIHKLDKDFLLDFLEQMYELNQYTADNKQLYCNGGGMTWIEKKFSGILSTIRTLVMENNLDKLSVLFKDARLLANKNIAQIEEILSFGLYNVDLGKMEYKAGTDFNSLCSVQDVAKAIKPVSMNDLEHFFFLEKHNKMTKWGHYFEVYDRHLKQFRNKSITLLEIGVWGGGSLQMWKKYFGQGCNIIGIDIMEECKNYEEEGIQIYIGSQEDKEFLKRLKEQIPRPDIIIDDGGHTMNQQIVTFEEMFSFLAEGGIYLCEDTHTSYWPDFNGEYKKQDTFLEYSKNFIDRLHARYTVSPELQPDYFTRNVRAVHYYDSIVVLEKGEHKPTMPFWI